MPARTCVLPEILHFTIYYRLPLGYPSGDVISPKLGDGPDFMREYATGPDGKGSEEIG